MVLRTLGFESGLGAESGLWRNEGWMSAANWLDNGKRNQGLGMRLEGEPSRKSK